MRISPISTYSNMNFKGYDARKLKSIAITEVGAQCEVAKQLDDVARNNGFELEILNDDELRPLSYCFEITTFLFPASLRELSTLSVQVFSCSRLI